MINLAKSKSLFLTRLQPLLGMQVGLEHPLVEQHVAHRLRDDHVHLFRQLDLLDLARDDLDDAVQLVGADQHFCVLGNAGPFDRVHLSKKS